MSQNTLDTQVVGTGPDAVFLHGMDGLTFCQPFLHQLSHYFTVHAPSAPGWGASPHDPFTRTVDDLSYRYLDYIESIEAHEGLVLIGASLGGWLAAEVATKSCSKIAAVILLAPLGLRTGSPTERNYLDIYASSPQLVASALYGDSRRAPNLGDYSTEVFYELAKAQEATANLVWEPYMHSSQLRSRLHRIKSPTLVLHGERDGLILNESLPETWAKSVGGPSEVAMIQGVGHRMEEEEPTIVTRFVTEFVHQYAFSL